MSLSVIMFSMLTRARSVPLALFFGIVVPTAVGLLWNDVSGAYVWGGLVSRVISEWRDPWVLLWTDVCFSKFGIARSL